MGNDVNNIFGLKGVSKQDYDTWEKQYKDELADVDDETKRQTFIKYKFNTTVAKDNPNAYNNVSIEDKLKVFNGEKKLSDFAPSVNATRSNSVGYRDENDVGDIVDKTIDNALSPQQHLSQDAYERSELIKMLQLHAAEGNDVSVDLGSNVSKWFSWLLGLSMDPQSQSSDMLVSTTERAYERQGQLNNKTTGVLLGIEEARNNNIIEYYKQHPDAETEDLLAIKSMVEENSGFYKRYKNDKQRQLTEQDWKDLLYDYQAAYQYYSNSLANVKGGDDEALYQANLKLLNSVLKIYYKKMSVGEAYGHGIGSFMTGLTSSLYAAQGCAVGLANFLLYAVTIGNYRGDMPEGLGGAGDAFGYFMNNNAYSQYANEISKRGWGFDGNTGLTGILLGGLIADLIAHKIDPNMDEKVKKLLENLFGVKYDYDETGLNAFQNPDDVEDYSWSNVGKHMGSELLGLSGFTTGAMATSWGASKLINLPVKYLPRFGVKGFFALRKTKDLAKLNKALARTEKITNAIIKKSDTWLVPTIVGSSEGILEGVSTQERTLEDGMQLLELEYWRYFGLQQYQELASESADSRRLLLLSLCNSDEERAKVKSMNDDLIMELLFQEIKSNDERYLKGVKEVEYAAALAGADNFLWNSLINSTLNLTLKAGLLNVSSREFIRTNKLLNKLKPKFAKFTGVTEVEYREALSGGFRAFYKNMPKRAIAYYTGKEMAGEFGEEFAQSITDAFSYGSAMHNIEHFVETTYDPNGAKEIDHWYSWIPQDLADIGAGFREAGKAFVDPETWKAGFYGAAGSAFGSVKLPGIKTLARVFGKNRIARDKAGNVIRDENGNVKMVRGIERYTYEDGTRESKAERNLRVIADILPWRFGPISGYMEWKSERDSRKRAADDFNKWISTPGNADLFRSTCALLNFLMSMRDEATSGTAKTFRDAKLGKFVRDCLMFEKIAETETGKAWLELLEKLRGFSSLTAELKAAYILEAKVTEDYQGKTDEEIGQLLLKRAETMLTGIDQVKLYREEIQDELGDVDEDILGSLIYGKMAKQDWMSRGTMLSNEIEETKRKIRVSRAESGASDDVKSVIARYGSKRKFKHYVRSLEKRIEVDKEKLETEKENLRALEKNLKEELKKSEDELDPRVIAEYQKLIIETTRRVRLLNESIVQNSYDYKIEKGKYKKLLGEKYMDRKAREKAGIRDEEDEGESSTPSSSTSSSSTESSGSSESESSEDDVELRLRRRKHRVEDDDDDSSDPFNAVLNEEEIMALDEATRARMLNPNNRGLYSPEQLAVIQNIETLGLTEDAGFMEKIQDLAEIRGNIESVDKEYTDILHGGNMFNARINDIKNRTRRALNKEKYIHLALIKDYTEFAKQIDFMWNTDPYNFDAIEFAKVMEEYNPKFFKTFMDNKTTKSGVIDAITKGLLFNDLTLSQRDEVLIAINYLMSTGVDILNKDAVALALQKRSDSGKYAIEEAIEELNQYLEKEDKITFSGIETIWNTINKALDYYQDRLDLSARLSQDQRVSEDVDYIPSSEEGPAHQDSDPRTEAELEAELETLPEVPAAELATPDVAALAELLLREELIAQRKAERDAQRQETLAASEALRQRVEKAKQDLLIINDRIAKALQDIDAARAVINDRNSTLEDVNKAKDDLTKALREKELAEREKVAKLLRLMQEEIAESSVEETNAITDEIEEARPDISAGVIKELRSVINYALATFKRKALIEATSDRKKYTASAYNKLLDIFERLKANELNLENKEDVSKFLSDTIKELIALNPTPDMYSELRVLQDMIRDTLAYYQQKDRATTEEEKTEEGKLLKAPVSQMFENDRNSTNSYLIGMSKAMFLATEWEKAKMVTRNGRGAFWYNLEQVERWADKDEMTTMFWPSIANSTFALLNPALAKYFADHHIQAFLERTSEQLLAGMKVFFYVPSELAAETQRRKGANYDASVASPLVAVVESENGTVEIDGKRYQPIGLFPNSYNGNNANYSNRESRENSFWTERSAGMGRTYRIRLSAQRMSLSTDHLITDANGIISSRIYSATYGNFEQTLSPVLRATNRPIFTLINELHADAAKGREEFAKNMRVTFGSASTRNQNAPLFSSRIPGLGGTEGKWFTAVIIKVAETINPRTGRSLIQTIQDFFSGNNEAPLFTLGINGAKKFNSRFLSIGTRMLNAIDAYSKTNVNDPALIETFEKTLYKSIFNSNGFYLTDGAIKVRENGQIVLMLGLRQISILTNGPIDFALINDPAYRQHLVNSMLCNLLSNGGSLLAQGLILNGIKWQVDKLSIMALTEELRRLADTNENVALAVRDSLAYIKTLYDDGLIMTNVMYSLPKHIVNVSIMDPNLEGRAQELESRLESEDTTNQPGTTAYNGATVDPSSGLALDGTASRPLPLNGDRVRENQARARSWCALLLLRGWTVDTKGNYTSPSGQVYTSISLAYQASILKSTPNTNSSSTALWLLMKSIYSQDERNQYKELADRVFDLCALSGIGFRYGTLDNEVAGVYRPREHSVIISANINRLASENDRTVGELVLHEAIHALTIYAILNKEGLNREAQEAVTTLEECYKQLISQEDKSKVETDQDYYGLASVAEMVSEMANPKFREILLKHSLLDTVISAIKRLFSGVLVQRGQTLDLTVMNSLDSLLRNYNAPANLIFSEYKAGLALLFNKHNPMVIKEETFNTIKQSIQSGEESISIVMAGTAREISDYFSRKGYKAGDVIQLISQSASQRASNTVTVKILGFENGKVKFELKEQDYCIEAFNNSEGFHKDLIENTNTTVQDEVAKEARLFTKNFIKELATALERNESFDSIFSRVFKEEDHYVSSKSYKEIAKMIYDEVLSYYASGQRLYTDPTLSHTTVKVTRTVNGEEQEGELNMADELDMLFYDLNGNLSIIYIDMEPGTVAERGRAISKKLSTQKKGIEEALSEVSLNPIQICGAMKLLFDYGDLHNPATISMDTSGRLITESGNPLAGVKASFQKNSHGKGIFLARAFDTDYDYETLSDELLNQVRWKNANQNELQPAETSGSSERVDEVVRALLTGADINEDNGEVTSVEPETTLPTAPIELPTASENNDTNSSEEELGSTEPAIPIEEDPLGFDFDESGVDWERDDSNDDVSRILVKKPKYNRIYEKAVKAKNYLLSPVQKVTNLTLEQWLITRTPSFRAWFGEWETNPTTEMLLDENHEPKVVYRTSLDIDPLLGKSEFVGSKQEAENRLRALKESEEALLYALSKEYNMPAHLINMFTDPEGLDACINRYLDRLNQGIKRDELTLQELKQLEDAIKEMLYAKQNLVYYALIFELDLFDVLSYRQHSFYDSPIVMNLSLKELLSNHPIELEAGFVRSYSESEGVIKASVSKENYMKLSKLAMKESTLNEKKKFTRVNGFKTSLGYLASHNSIDYQVALRYNRMLQDDNAWDRLSEAEREGFIHCGC